MLHMALGHSLPMCRVQYNNAFWQTRSSVSFIICLFEDFLTGRPQSDSTSEMKTSCDLLRLLLSLLQL